ncbi:MAG TPA: type VI secretion system tube protein Hcp, partial [Caulobacteraceae bacterium]
MRSASIVGVRPLFEPLENRVLLSASVHPAAAHPAAAVKPHVLHVAAAKKPAVKPAAAKKPAAKAPAATPVQTTLKGDPIYLKFPGIKGEVNLKGYTGDIQLSSLQWGASRTISAPLAGTTNRDASAPTVSEITITKSMDTTSPLLMQQALTGSATGEVDIFFVAPLGTLKPGQGAQPATYAEYALSNVMVSGYTEIG